MPNFPLHGRARLRWAQGSTIFVILGSACQGDAAQNPQFEFEDPMSDGASGSPDDPEGMAGDGEGAVTGRCDYVSRFTQTDECRDYGGAGWTDRTMTSDCDAWEGTLTLGQACSTDSVLGRCIVEEDVERTVDIVFYGDDPATCPSRQIGCESFAEGTWEPAEICEDSADGGEQLPELVCKDPLPKEPPGNGPDGQVCTLKDIRASTEEGRYFADYISCDFIRTSGRPYYPYPIPEDAERDDPRMDDPAYVAELEWVKTQIRASSCVCCHSVDTPNGPSNWYLEQPGNFINGFFDSGLAFGSGWIDSSIFGALDPADNNGFEREIAGIPSTDGPRMRDFFIAELERRGLSEEDFEGQSVGEGPTHDPRVHALRTHE